MAHNKQSKTRLSHASSTVLNIRGDVVDRRRSQAAKRAAITRKANLLAAQNSRVLKLRHKIFAGTLIAGVCVFTFIAIHGELTSYAATAKASQFIGTAGRCLDNASGDQKDGNRIQLWRCNQTKAQVWIVDANGAIRNSGGKADYCLNVTAATKTQSEQLRLTKCNGTATQKFTIVNNEIAAENTGLCITMRSGTTNGSRLRLASCTKPTVILQKWKQVATTVKTTPVTPVPTPTSTPTPAPTTTPVTTGTLPAQGTTIKVASTSLDAIRAAVNSVKAGGTVQFPAGTYTINSTLTLKADVLYQSTVGAVLKSTNGDTILNVPNASGVKIDGLTLDGGNILLGSDGTISNGAVVVNTTIKNVHSSNFGAGQALFLNRLANSRIESNKLLDNGNVSAGTNGIIAYNINTTSISKNTLTNNYQGMHIEPQSDTFGNGLVIDGNVLTGQTRMGIEVQGRTSGMIVSNNVLSGWVMGGDSNKIGLSIVSEGKGGTKVTGNKLTARNITEAPAIEFKGLNSVVSGNIIDGFGNGISVSAAKGTTFSGNTFTNVGKYGAFGRDGGYTGGEIIGSNLVNGATRSDLKL